MQRLKVSSAVDPYMGR